MNPLFLHVLDTNILVYAYDRREPEKREIAKVVLDALAERGDAAIPAQVLAEFASTALRLGGDVLTVEEISAEIEQLQIVFPVLPLTSAVVLEALRAVKAYKMSYYDAQIWAAAHLAQASAVVSEDFAVGARIEGVAFLDPFAADDPLALFA